ncbi:MAG: hypothetical protein R3F31_00930 [Verrucomicrobiales bacterium]
MIFDTWQRSPPTQGRRCVLVLDNASWHKVKTQPHHLEPVDFPPDSPDFTPSNSFGSISKVTLGGIHYQSGEELTTKRITSIQTLLDRPLQVVRSVCRTHSP